MEGLITAAGLGIRANTGRWFRKVMLPVYDIREGELAIRPVIDCIIERMENVGIKDITVVLDPQDLVTEQYIKLNRSEVLVEYQKERRGFGDAVRLGSKNINGRFLLNAGDGMLVDIDALKGLVESHYKTTLALMKVKDPKRYGIAEYERIGKGTYRITGLEEKPQNPKSNLALAAVYALDDGVTDYIDKEGENMELTTAIHAYMRDGNEVDGKLLQNGQWLSVGSAESYAGVLRATLTWARQRKSSQPSRDAASSGGVVL